MEKWGELLMGHTLWEPQWAGVAQGRLVLSIVLEVWKAQASVGKGLRES